MGSGFGGGHFAAQRDDALDAFGAEDGVDERGEPRGGGEMLGLEFLRVGEVIAQLLDVAREAVGFAARMSPSAARLALSLTRMSALSLTCRQSRSAQSEPRRWRSARSATAFSKRPGVIWLCHESSG